MFANYRKLLTRVDDFSSRFIRMYKEQIVCRHGCTDCCRHNLHLLPVEFHYLKQGFTRLPEAEKNITESSSHDTYCTLLHEGSCLLYDLRPIICRTHGLPLLITKDDTQWRDCCPKNFKGQSLEHLPEKDFLDLEKLNTMLVTVNMVFSSRIGVDAGKRIPISGLAGCIESK